MLQTLIGANLDTFYDVLRDFSQLQSFLDAEYENPHDLQWTLKIGQFVFAIFRFWLMHPEMIFIMPCIIDTSLACCPYWGMIPAPYWIVVLCITLTSKCSSRCSSHLCSRVCTPFRGALITAWKISAAMMCLLIPYRLQSSIKFRFLFVNLSGFIGISGAASWYC